MKDLDKVVKIEHAISKRYGEETIVDPRSLWTDEKERDYLDQLRNEEKKESERGDKKVEIEEGVFISDRLFTKKSIDTCIECSKYSFDKKDDLYLNRYGVCWKCYVVHVEGREEKYNEDDRKEFERDNSGRD